MKLEIDIPSILYNDAKENRGYISINKMEIAWKAIADGKPLEQEPRKGHWIYDKSIANWICSKCGETPKTIGYVGTGVFMAEHFKYCNHCGAEMEGCEEV